MQRNHLRYTFSRRLFIFSLERTYIFKYSQKILLVFVFSYSLPLKTRLLTFLTRFVFFMQDSINEVCLLYVSKQVLKKSGQF